MEAVKTYDQFLFSYDVLRNLNAKPHKRRVFTIKGSKIYWDHKSEKYVKIGEGSPGTYTFYKTKDLSKKGKNIRVRHTTTLPGAHTKAWFKDREKAESGLRLYAKQYRWRELKPEELI